MSSCWEGRWSSRGEPSPEHRGKDRTVPQQRTRDTKVRSLLCLLSTKYHFNIPSCLQSMAMVHRCIFLTVKSEGVLMAATEVACSQPVDRWAARTKQWFEWFDMLCS
jgi:hypothetical protein